MCDQAAARGFAIVWGRCVRFDAIEAPYHPLLTALNVWAEDADPSDRAQVFEGAADVEEFSAMLTNRQPTRATGLFAAIDAAITRISALTPTILVIDDLQWADLASRDALTYLIAGSHRVAVDGPDPITSPEYAFDYEEVKRTGAAVDADRTPFQTDTAQFFNSNSAIMLSEGLLRRLAVHPLTLSRTVRLFAVMHAAMTDSIITCWRLKYHYGFWRPFQAIPGAGTDGNPATEPDAAWTPLIATPPYPEYVSGHACLTAPAAEAIRRTLGETTSLTLHSYNTGADRTYSTLSALEYDAFHARIWSGLHFRDAMEDGYYVGHTAARRVLRLID